MYAYTSGCLKSVFSHYTVVLLLAMHNTCSRRSAAVGWENIISCARRHVSPSTRPRCVQKEKEILSSRTIRRQKYRFRHGSLLYRIDFTRFPNSFPHFDEMRENNLCGVCVCVCARTLLSRSFRQLGWLHYDFARNV